MSFELSRQREFIRLLVATMCDNDEISRLVSLNFIGYQADVESTLAFKARNTDPRQTPQYAHVLHAWYVFRGDFRSGEHVSSMFV
jgi:nuclear pore complex protein Nup160